MKKKKIEENKIKCPSCKIITDAENFILFRIQPFEGVMVCSNCGVLFMATERVKGILQQIREAKSKIIKPIQNEIKLPPINNPIELIKK